MDFQVLLVNGLGAMTFNANTDIRTNIWFSLNIEYGRWWQQPSFGHKLGTIKKLGTSDLLLAKQYVQDALQWLIQVGRATAIDVAVEKDSDPRTPGRMNIKVQATQPNGLIIKYQQFYAVV